MKLKMYIIWSGVVTMLATLTYADATVRLSNVDSLMPVYWREAGNLAAGNDFYIEVLGAPLGGLPIPMTPIGAATPIIKLKEPGYYDGGIGLVLGSLDNVQVTLKVRGWYGSPTFGEAAVLANAGETIEWMQLAGSWDPNSGLAPTGPSLEMPWPLEIGFAIPEPSTVTLTILGAGLLLGASRKKMLGMGKSSREIIGASNNKWSV